MAVVMDYVKNGVHIIVRDDYAVKTKEENDAILRRVGEIWGRALRKAMEQEMAERVQKEGGDGCTV